MRKILNIGGNDVAFDCAAATPIFYKKEFGKNYFGDMLKLNRAVEIMNNPKKATNEELENIDLDVISRLAWACAKTADQKNTKGYLDWLIENADFNIASDGVVIAELISQNYQTKKK